MFDHLLSGSLVAVEDTVEVDVEHAVDIFGGELEERFDLGDAGIRNHYAQGTECGDGLLDEGFNFAEGGDVGDYANRFATQRLDLLDCLLMSLDQSSLRGAACEEIYRINARVVGGYVIDADIVAIMG